mgnify:CR=1 FL=1
MKKLLGIIVLGLLLSGNAYALETPMKKLSKYFKTGELIKISSYTVPGWPNQYKSIEDGTYKNTPLKVDAFIAFPKKGEGPFPVVMFAHASGGAKIGGNKGGAFKKPFLKFFTENLLN